MEYKHIHKEEIAEHDNGYVHKIISNQYRCQQTFGIIQKKAYLFVSRMFAFVNIILVRGRKREKSYF